MVTILDHASLLAERKQGMHQRIARYQVGGEMRTLNFRIDNGRVILPANVAGEVGTLGSLSGLTNISQLTGRMALEIEIGRERVVPLYGPIYETMTDPTYPELLEGKWAMHGVVYFAQVVELEEIQFGHFAAEQGPGVPIRTFAAMLPVTRQMIDFNQGWNISEVGRSFGEAHNALLNHLHFGPIVTHTYAAGNQTAYAGAEGDPKWLAVHKTLSDGIAAADAAMRPVNILAASRVHRQSIEQAIRGGQVGGTIYPPLPIDTVIYYDGWNITWRKKVINYPGFGARYGYLIRGKRGFKELVKRDLVTEQVAGDPSRMVDDVWRGYSYRGVYAAVTENVQRVDLTGG